MNSEDCRPPDPAAAMTEDGFAPWPAAFVARYRLEGLWAGVALGEALRSWAQRWGPRTALIAGPQRLTYADLDGAVDRMATDLSGLALRQGERVVVQLDNRLDFVIVSFALFRLGVTPVFALPAHRRAEIMHIAVAANVVAYFGPAAGEGFDYIGMAKAVCSAAPSLRHILSVGPEGVSPRPLKPRHADTARAIKASDIAFFLLSGGTTGPPKLVPRTHDDYLYNIRMAAETAGLTQDSVYLAVLPIAHNFALGCPGVLGVLSVGGRAILASELSPHEMLALIDQEKITLCALTPPLAVLWLEAAEAGDYDLSSLALLQVGGAKLNTEHAKRVRPALGCRLQQSFGMAEGILIQTRPTDPESLVLRTQGRPISPADEIRIVDEQDNDLPPDTVGHLLARGPYTIRGYYDAADFNAHAFTADGYLRTGDKAKRSPLGFITLMGRANEIINRGGEKISAEEVESHLLTHPQVQDAAVVAFADALMGQRSCAFIVPRGGRPTQADIADHLHARGLAAFKIPDRLELMDGLAVTPVGKVDRAALRRMLALCDVC